MFAIFKTQGLESNIWKIGVDLITNKRSYMSILGVYLLTLPEAIPQTIGLMILVGNLAGFIFEIPSGYLSDKMGHKNALVLSRALLLLSSLLFLAGNNVLTFLMASAFLNIGFAFKSGTLSAFIHETLKELGKEDEYSKISGRLSAIGFAVPVVLIVAAPFLVAISFKLPFLLAAIVDVIGLLAALAYVNPQKTKEQIKEISNSNLRKVIKEGRGYKYFRYAFFTAILAGSVTAVTGFKDAYQAFLGVPVIYYGIFWGVSRILISGILPFNHVIKRAFTFHQFLGLRTLLAVALVVSLGIFVSSATVVIVFILAATLSHSFGSAQKHYFLDIIGASNFKATLLSLKNLVSTLTFGVGAYVLGIIITQTTYATAFLLFGTTLAVSLGVWLIILIGLQFKYEKS